MTLPPAHGNPLKLIALAMGLAGLSNLYWEVFHQFTLDGLTLICVDALFFIFYFRRSPFAWHASFVMTTSNIPLSLLHRSLVLDATRHPTTTLVVIDLSIVVLLLVYLWKIRERYFRYVQLKSNHALEATATRREI